MVYKIMYTKTARAMIASIQQPQRSIILGRIKQLETEPEKSGKALWGPLRGHRSLHVSRYRVIYRVVRDEIQVFILFVGMRKEGDKDDVYKLAERLVRNFLAK